MKKKKDGITIRSSAVEYLTYVASVGDQQDSIGMRYADENVWLTQKMMAVLYDVDVRTNISIAYLNRFVRFVSLSVDFIRR